MGHGVVREWRCRCGKLLGVVHHRRIHLRFPGPHEYFVTRPVTTSCPKCRTMNEIADDGDDALTGR